MVAFTNALTPAELKAAIVRQPLILFPETSVMEAVAHMSGIHQLCLPTQTAAQRLDELHIEARSSCVLVVEAGQLLGIVTERDIVKLSAAGQDLTTTCLRDLLTRPVVTLRESDFVDLFSTVNLLQQHHIRHLPLVDDRGGVVGLLTHESLRQVSRPVDLLRLRLVIEVMAYDVVCAHPEQSMLTVAQLMANHSVSSVMVVDQDLSTRGTHLKRPIGIITERDLVQFRALNLDIVSCPAQAIMSTPVFTVKAEDSLWDVHQIMEQRMIRRLAVTGSQGELIGIITQTSLLQAIQPLELYRLAAGLEARVSQLEAEKIELLTQRNQELEREVQVRTVALEAKAQREKLLATVASQIRASLDLNEILKTTVREVRSLLGCDRVVLYEFAADDQGQVIAEAKLPGTRSILHQVIANPCLATPCGPPYLQGQARSLDDALATAIAPHEQQQLMALGLRAQLLVPVIVADQLWGLLIASYQSFPHAWQTEEIDIVEQLSIQVAIAIRQATIHHQLQIELEERNRAEVSLQRSQQTNLALIAAMPDLLIRMTVEGDYLDLASGHAVQVIHPSGDISQTTIYEMLPAELAHERLQYVRQTLATQSLQVYEQVLEIKDELRWEEVRIVPCGEQEVLIIIRDITERKRTEDALLAATAQLQESELRFRAIFNNSFQFIGLLTPDGRLLEVNDTALRFGGLRRSDIVHRPFWELRWWTKTIAARERLKDAIARAAQGEFVRYEEEVIGIDDHTAIIDFSIRPLRDETGKITLLIPEGRDITELKQAEAALRKSEAQGKAVLSAIPDLMFCVGADGCYRSYIVSNGLVDFFPVGQQPVGRHLADVLPPPVAERHLYYLQQAIATGEVQVYEQALQIGDRYQYEEVRVARSGADEALFMIRDISDRKLAELALQDLNQTLEIQVAERTQALQQVSTLQQAILDGTDYSIIATDLNGIILTFNAAAQYLLGYRPEEVIGKTTPILFHDPEEMQQRAADLAAELGQPIQPNFELFSTQAHLGFVNEQEWTYVCKDGSRFPVALTITALRDAAGQIFGFIGIAKDITQRKQAAQHLQNLSDRLKLAVQSAQIGIWDWDIRHDRLIWDDYMYQLYDMDPIDFDSTSHAWLNRLYPDDRTTIHSLLQQAVQGQCDFDPEIRIVRQDGEVRVLKAHALVQRDDNGQPCRMIGVNFDITERKRAEVKLRENESRFQRISLNTPGIIYQYVLRTDGTHEFVYLSDRVQDIVELPPATIYQNADLVFAMVHVEDMAKLQQAIQTSAQNLQQWSWEGRIIAPSGREKWLQGISQPERLPNGDVLWDGLLLDVSDRKQAEAELREAYRQLAESNEQLARATRLKDEFLANMSHELRTPLNAILGMSEALQESVYGTLNPQQQHALNTIERSGTHLLSLINDILDLSKIEAGRLELELTAVNVTPLCKSSWALVKQQAAKKQLQFTMQVPPHLPQLQVDERRLRQVLINLLNNAVKFTPAGGRVELTVTLLTTAHEPEADSAIRFDVTDTGIGIAPTAQARLFQPFTQIDGALNRQYNGTGLGLALVKKIVCLHGGEVGVTSEVNVGSCFSFTLPASCLLWETDAAKPLSRSSLDAPIATTTDQSPLILLAEDNEANISTVAGYLEARGYRMALAHDGEAAVRLAHEVSPDLILMDIQMPGMDGLEAIAMIRQTPNLSTIPIIALTALAMPGDRDRCLQAGANEYVAKPLKLKQLALTIQQCLAAYPGTVHP